MELIQERKTKLEKISKEFNKLHTNLMILLSSLNKIYPMILKRRKEKYPNSQKIFNQHKKLTKSYKPN